MPDPKDQPPSGPSRAVAKLGMALSALGVFTCGWLAMRTDDWRMMAVYTVLALAAAMVGSTFSRLAR
jgi:hypothetical protein